MKHILLICAVVMGQSVLAADERPLITDPIVEKRIRQKLKKPGGQLTEADLEKFTVLSFVLFDLTDAGLKEVAKFQKLTFLGLNDTKITDEGLKEVAKLQQLKTLFLLKNENHLTIQVTDAGVAELQKALPNCRIISNPKK